MLSLNLSEFVWLNSHCYNELVSFSKMTSNLRSVKKHNKFKYLLLWRTYFVPKALVSYIVKEASRLLHIKSTLPCLVFSVN